MLLVPVVVLVEMITSLLKPVSSKDWVLHNKPPWTVDTSTLEGGCDSECGSDKENSCYS